MTPSTEPSQAVDVAVPAAPASAFAAPVAAPERLAGSPQALLGAPSAFVTLLALRPPEERARVLRALSRTSGNRAVSAMLARSEKPGANKFAGKTDRQLKYMARKDPAAAFELERRADERAAKTRWTPEREKAGEFKRWDGHQLPHEAKATSQDANGKQVWSGQAKSGGQSAEQKTRFPAGMFETHTEAKLIEDARASGGLTRGGRMTIRGQYDPCGTCRTAMRQAAVDTGCTIEYLWEGGAEQSGHVGRFLARPSAPRGGGPMGGVEPTSPTTAGAEAPKPTLPTEAGAPAPEPTLPTEAGAGAPKPMSPTETGAGAPKPAAGQALNPHRHQSVPAHQRPAPLTHTRRRRGRG